MRLLLDECLPKDFAGEIPGHTVQTVQQASWASIKNGKVLRLIADSKNFDEFLTVDKNIPVQQKIEDLPFAVVVLRTKSNRLPDVVPFVAELLRRWIELLQCSQYNSIDCGSLLTFLFCFHIPRVA